MAGSNQLLAYLAFGSTMENQRKATAFRAMVWQIIDTGPGTAEENMQLDRELLAGLHGGGDPILHLYSFLGDCATYGYFIRLEGLINEQAAKRLPLNLARRPTGGGIVFHKADLAFSALVPEHQPFCSPNTLENYAFINRRVAEALSVLLGRGVQAELLPSDAVATDGASGKFCMARPTIYDVIINGKKAGGAAQRRTRAGYLHQGTLSLGRLPDDYLAGLLLPGTHVLESMQRHTFSLLPDGWSCAQLEEARAEARQALIASFRKVC